MLRGFKYRGVGGKKRGGGDCCDKSLRMFHVTSVEYFSVFTEPDISWPDRNLLADKTRNL